MADKPNRKPSKPAPKQSLKRAAADQKAIEAAGLAKKGGNPGNGTVETPKKGTAENGVGKATARKKPNATRAPGLGERFIQAATLMGHGMSALKASEHAGVDHREISKLRWGADARSKQFQSALLVAIEHGIAMAQQTAMQRLVDVTESGADKDAVAAARELAGLAKILNEVKAHGDKIAVERDRLQIQRDAADKAADTNTPIGVVYLPTKDASQWLPAKTQSQPGIQPDQATSE